MKQINLFIILIIFAAGLISGCGYHFRADGKPIGNEMKSLAIPLMESRSSELGFENEFTEAIRSEFIRHAGVPLVSRNNADVVLLGKIFEVRFEPLTYQIRESTVGGEDTDYEITDSRRLRISLDTELIDRKTGKSVWKEKGMEEQARYLVTKDPLTNRYNQRKALREIAARIVDRLYLKTMERF